MSFKNIIAACILTILVQTIPFTNCFAVGLWNKGIITKAAWKSKYIYINIDNERYTIMKNTEVLTVYSQNGSEYHDPIKLSALKVGDTLVYKAEGNRIYSIQQMK